MFQEAIIRLVVVAVSLILVGAVSYWVATVVLVGALGAAGLAGIDLLGRTIST